METLWQKFSVFLNEASRDEYRWILVIVIIATITITTLVVELIRLRWWVKRHAKAHREDMADLCEKLAAIESDLEVEALLEQIARSHAADVAHAEPSDHLSQQLGAEVITRFVEWLKVNASDVLGARFQQMAKNNANEAVAGKAEELVLNMALGIGQGRFDHEISACLAAEAKPHLHELCQGMEDTIMDALKKAILRRLSEDEDEILTNDMIRDGISELLAAGIKKLAFDPSGGLSEELRQLISQRVCETIEEWIDQRDVELEKASEKIFPTLRAT